jgi:intracellular sulfur oxidation DsrE/DsrF family protein
MKNSTRGDAMRLFAVLMSFLAVSMSTLALPAMAADDGVRVVYHVDEGLQQASNALRNIRNHLDTDPTVKIVVVAHAAGIDFLLKGAKDKNGNSYATRVEDLALAGVDFRVCNVTLKSRNIDPRQVLPDAHIVPSGVAEIARLQAREGFAYIKP